MEDLEVSLLDAVSSLDLCKVERLLGLGVLLNFLPNNGQPPPLHAALLHSRHRDGRQLALVQMMLLAGADPEFVDAEGKTGTEVAVSQGRSSLVRLLASCSSPTTARHVIKQEEPTVTSFYRYYLKVVEYGTSSRL